MNIQLSDHFTYPRLIRFVLPSVAMMIFTSIYCVVDGLFVSNFVGKIPFAAINLMMPFLMIMASIGFMLGTGGSALVAKTIGEGDRARANRYFSLIIYTAILSGIVLTVFGELFLNQIVALLGAEGAMFENCIIYGRIMLIGNVAYMLQTMFQSFLITAEKPGMGLAVTILAGVTNMVLDAFFIAGLKWGIAGAAVATTFSQFVGALIPLFYFCRKNTSLLRLTRTSFMGSVLFRTCSNGISELLSNISMSLVSVLYNFQLIRIVGDDGVAAYGVIMYVQFIFVAIFIGYAIGVAPIIGFNYGAQNHNELKNMFKKSNIIIWLTGVVLMLTAFGISGPFSEIFVGYDRELLLLTERGFKFLSASFLFCGFNIFGSSFFTALNNGIVSAVISFTRTIIFQVSAVLTLPMIWGIDGIWISVPVAEVASVVLTLFFMMKLRGKYHYV